MMITSLTNWSVHYCSCQQDIKLENVRQYLCLVILRDERHLFVDVTLVLCKTGGFTLQPLCTYFAVHASVNVTITARRGLFQ